MPPRPDRVGAAPALLGTRFRAPSARRARARGCLPRLRLPSVRRDRRLTRFEPPSQSRLGRHRQCRVRCSPTLLAFRLVAKGQMGHMGVQLLNTTALMDRFRQFSRRGARADPSTTWREHSPVRPGQLLPIKRIQRAGDAFVHVPAEFPLSALRLPRTAFGDDFDLHASRARCKGEPIERPGGRPSACADESFAASEKFLAAPITPTSSVAAAVTTLAARSQ